MSLAPFLGSTLLRRGITERWEALLTQDLDPWRNLRSATPARVALTRTGDALALTHVLDLQLGHARARDAVHVPMDAAKVAADLAPHEVIEVRSKAADRSIYLRRPDLGRALDPACRKVLEERGALDQRGARNKGEWDAVFVVADGLSSSATESHAAGLVAATIRLLPGSWRIAPFVVATQARVALLDEIGESLGARLGAILIGERPGLSAADSLGVYLTWGPRRGRRDSERNCISNIHGGGLAVKTAAEKLAWLMTEASKREMTGVKLKDEMPATIEASSSGLLPPDRPQGR